MSRRRWLLTLGLFVTGHAAAQTPPPPAPRAPMVDSLRHAPGKLVKITSGPRPTSFASSTECKKVKLPAVGSDVTGSYYPVTVKGFIPPKSAEFPNDFPSQFWLDIDATGKFVKIEYLKKPSADFGKAMEKAIKASTFSPAIYQNCPVEAWLIGLVQKR